MSLILEGNIVDAVTEVSQHFPQVLSGNEDLCFSLKCQLYIELIRQRNIKEALQFAQSELAPFGSRNQKYLNLLQVLAWLSQLMEIQDIIALMAYDSPETSPLGSYLSEEHRQSVADSLNSAILSSLNQQPTSSLVQLMKHLTVVRDTLYEETKSVGLLRFMHVHH